jgi:hypothetical protein
VEDAEADPHVDEEAQAIAATAASPTASASPAAVAVAFTAAGSSEGGGFIHQQKESGKEGERDAMEEFWDFAHSTLEDLHDKILTSGHENTCYALWLKL